MDVGALRREYTLGGLKREDLSKHPMDQFERWFAQTRDAGLLEPNAMSLATMAPSGTPTLRTVLLKYFDRDGFVFFTNLESRKAHHISQTPGVALMFLWSELERQVSVVGQAERISGAAALRYFLSRPRGSQLGAWVSHQSSIISSRQLLEMKLDEMKRKFEDREVPLPSFWGGYRVRPTSVEFWQGRPNRLHDRFEYVLQEDGAWTVDRRAP